MKKLKLLMLVLVMSLAFSACGKKDTGSSEGISGNKQDEKEDSDNGNAGGNGNSEFAAVFENAKAGDIVTFGNYDGMSIEWYVLDKEDGGEVILFSVNGVGTRQYNDALADVSWESCTLREWLNADFYNSAFSAAEQAVIVQTPHSGENNPHYGTVNDTNCMDNVWLLSLDEVEKYFSIDTAKWKSYLKDDITFDAYNEYCTNQDNRINIGSPWWLRSPGRKANRAARVGESGGVFYDGYNVNGEDGVVRPVIKVSCK